MFIRNSTEITPSVAKAERDVTLARCAFKLIVGLWQFGVVAWVASLILGFVLTAATDPNHELEDVLAWLVFLAFFAIAVLSFVYVLWVSFLMSKNSPRFPVAWTIQTVPLIVLILLHL
jgi:hypothetical protein